MTHAEMDDLYELYVLRVLEPPLALEIEEHLRTECEYCQSHIEDARRTTTALAALANAHTAPAAVRARVLQAIDPAPKLAVQQLPAPRRPWPWLVLAASLVLAALCGWEALQVGAQNERIKETQQALQKERAQTAAAERNQTQAARTEAASLTEQLRTAQTQANDLRSQLNATRGRLTEQAGALTASASEAESLRSQNTSTSNQLGSTQSQLTAALANLTSLQNRLTASQTETSDVRSQLLNVRSELTRLTAERDTLQAAVRILNRPRTRTVAFGNDETDPHGRVLLDQTGGVVFLASSLPPVGSGRALELWIVPKSGAAPVPAGLLSRDANGASSKVLSQGVDASQIKALAVSDEPAAGSAAPTTKPFLLVPLG